MKQAQWITGLWVALLVTAATPCASARDAGNEARSYPWGDATPEPNNSNRRESPFMQRQPADTGHLMSLYEAWMIEVFCARPRNEQHVGLGRADCIRGVGGEPVARCSARLRSRIPMAYEDGNGRRHSYTKFVRAYQSCLQRSVTRLRAGGS